MAQSIPWMALVTTQNDFTFRIEDDNFISSRKISCLRGAYPLTLKQERDIFPHFVFLLSSRIWENRQNSMPPLCHSLCQPPRVINSNVMRTTDVMLRNSIVNICSLKALSCQSWSTNSSCVSAWEVNGPLTNSAVSESRLSNPSPSHHIWVWVRVRVRESESRI